MEYKFSKSRYKDEGAVRLNGHVIIKCETFRYLKSIIYEDRNAKDVNYNIRAGWGKWGSAT